MAQPQSNPKIEELRFRIKTDPKSRLFYPLAEELRKVSRFDEAEQVLRNGLEYHPTYLSAWVSLGRVLRELRKNDGAVEALKKALQLDPGNVVAARLLADAYVDMGDKIEAIKKYKLVHALLPSDDELELLIDRLDREVNPPFPVAVEEAPPLADAPAIEEETPFAAPAAPLDETRPGPHQPTIETPFAEETQVGIATGDAEPMAAAHAESPFEEPAGYTAASLTVEQPAGFSIEPAPLAAEVATPWAEDVERVLNPSQVEEHEDGSRARPTSEDELTNTLTMADLYARQGLTADARQIYENILQRDPENAGVRAKLEALAKAAKVAKLERWLAKVKHV